MRRCCPFITGCHWFWNRRTGADGWARTSTARLMLPGAAGMLDFHRVDPAVNSNRASGPELIEPFEDGDIPRGRLI